MFETEEARRARHRQDDLARLRGLRPIDDDFMRCIFRDNKPLAQLVLRILTGKNDLVVLELETQKDLKRLVGARSLCLDCYASDSSGKKYDLEIQRASKGAGAHRARYHSGAMDVENLDAGQAFEELPDTYTIFITEEDVMGEGLPCYQIERMNVSTGKPFNDGSHILYVNGTYRGDTEIGRLMHDFSCWDPAEMNFELLRDATKYYKETQEGVEYMCKACEEVRAESRSEGRAEGRQEEKLNNIRSFMASMNMTAKQVMDALNIPPEQQAKYSELL